MAELVGGEGDVSWGKERREGTGRSLNREKKKNKLTF